MSSLKASATRMWSAASGATSSLPLLAQSALPSALDKAEALASAISAAPFEWEGQPIPPTIAYGVYTFKLGESVDDALAAADRAMYANKQNARGAEG